MTERETRGGPSLLRRRPNTLVIGTTNEIETALAQLASCFHERQYLWPDIPPTIPGLHATVIVRDLLRLAATERDDLGRVVATAAGHVQIVSTASPSIWEAVERGDFPATLYYRLNVVVVGGWLARDDGAEQSTAHLRAKAR